MYLVFPDATALAEIGIAVARAYMPDATARGLGRRCRGTWCAPHRGRRPRTTDVTPPPRRPIPATFELQAAIVAAARASGQPGARRRPRPAELAGHRRPAAAFFLLGAVRRRRGRARPAPTRCGARRPPADGIADRLDAALAGDGSPGARVPGRGHRLRRRPSSASTPDAWVARAGARRARRRVPVADADARPPRAGAGALPRHGHRLADPGRPGAYQVFGTEGGAAAMAYVFRTLQENHLVAPGRQDRHRHADLHAVPADPGARGLRVRRRRAGRRPTTRRTASTTSSSSSCSTRRSRSFFIVNPGNPDSRAHPPGEADPAARPRARASGRTW